MTALYDARENNMLHRKNCEISALNYSLPLPCILAFVGLTVTSPALHVFHGVQIHACICTLSAPPLTCKHTEFVSTAS